MATGTLWQEETTEAPATPVSDVVDVSFRVRCRALPVEHAYALSEAIRAVLPWLAEDPRAGVHTIHVAESGHGWSRPTADDGEPLYLSRRTRLVLRVPARRLPDAKCLTGQILDIDGHVLEVEAGAERPLGVSATLFSRYVVSDGYADEAAFVDYVVAALGDMGIQPRRLLCGRTHGLATPEGVIGTRSVMVTDLSPDASVRLQATGIGPLRAMGCGLFIPHKGIDAVS